MGTGAGLGLALANAGFSGGGCDDNAGECIGTIAGVLLWTSAGTVVGTVIGGLLGSKRPEVPQLSFTPLRTGANGRKAQCCPMVPMPFGQVQPTDFFHEGLP